MRHACFFALELTWRPSKGPEKSVSSLSAAEKQEQESSNTADQAPKPTTNASNGWSCFSCCGFWQ